MAITLAQLRSFLALAKTGRHVLAAKKLRISQPAVTVQIRSLEENYNVILFNRSGGNLVLSELGERLFTAANNAGHFLDEAEELLISENDLSAGTLRVGACHPAYVMGAIAAFSHQHPNVAIKVTMGSAPSVIKRLLNYEIDVAFVTSISEPTELFARPFYNLALHALVPLDHPWTKRKAVSLDDVAAAERVILREHGSVTRKVFQDALYSVGLSANIILELSNQGAVREAVMSGLGVAVELGGLSTTKRAAMVPIRGHELAAKEYVACHRDRAKTKKVQRFFELAASVAGANSNI